MKENNFIRLLLFLILCCESQNMRAQSFCNSPTDSIVKVFMIKNNILLDPVSIRKYENGRVVSETKNYYINQNMIKVSDTSTIDLVVFGAYSDHPRDYLLVIYNTYGSSKHFFLGKDRIEVDLLTIASFFDKSSHTLPLGVKRKILNTFSTLN